MVALVVEGKCPSCGAEVSRESWIAGQCPACLVKLGLAAAVRGDPGAGSNLPTLSSPAATPSDSPTALYPESPAVKGETFTPGELLGERYRIESLLGRGGMGEVWRAYDLKLRLEVALKSLHPKLFDTKEGLELLRDEVRAAREVTSPNVCRLYDLVEVGERELVSMEYVDGVTLLEHLHESGPLELKEANEIASQLLAGLEAIHRAGLVHRDVKPENVMLTRTGRVVVMDFGLTSPSGTGSMAGTPAYMAPEQARGVAVDARADVFSVGMVLAEMLSAEAGPEESSRQTFWRSVREESPVVPESPWKGILQRALSPRAEERFASAQELARALEEVAFRVEGAKVEHPYPGLASFQEDEAEFFFGREAEVEAVWKKLAQAHLLGLIGPSGSGKSSFINAGLLPASPEGWSCVRMTPGGAPYASLGRVLLPALEGDAAAMEALVALEDAASALTALRSWRAGHEQALLIVDQFEELFTQTTGDVQRRFAELLGRAALDADVHVLLSMRDDFLLRCHDFEPLAPVFSELTPLKPPMGSALRRAVVQPALRCGYRFEEESVVEAMLEEVTRERGALPLIAFTAAQLWERRDKETGYLTREAYEEIGGVGGALAQHAETTLEQIGSEHIPIVRELFRNLVTAQGTRVARGREELLSVFEATETAGTEAGRFDRESELKRPGSVPAGAGGGVGEGLVPFRAGASPAPTSAGVGGSDDWRLTTDDRVAAAGVLDTLIDARLLTSYEVPADEEGGSPHHRIEIVHESLLSNWPRLVRWQMQDAEGAKLRDELRSQAQLWQQHDRSPDYLWTGAAYLDYLAWRERYPGGLTTTEEEFARAMTAHAERRRRRRRIAVAAVIAALIVGLAVVGGFWRRSVAEARRAEAAKLLALAQVQLDIDPTEALAYATASLDLADTDEARIFTMKALWAGPPLRALDLEGPPGGLFAVPSFSPDGRWLAVAGLANENVLVYGEDGREPVVLGGHAVVTGAIQCEWTGDGLLVTAHWTADRARIWAMPEGRLIREIDLGGSALWQVGDTHLLAEVMADDSTVGTTLDPTEATVLRLRSWRLPDGEPEELGTVELLLDPSEAWASAFDPNGEAWIYRKGDSIFSRPLPVRAGVPDRLIARHSSDTAQVSHWPRPLGLYSSDQRGEVVLWTTAEEISGQGRRLGTPETAATPLHPDPSGRWAVDADPDRHGKASLWDLQGLAHARPTELRRSGRWYYSHSDFHPGGRWVVATTNNDLEVSFWPLKAPSAEVVDGYGTNWRQPVAFTPDGRYLVTHWGQDRVRLWPLPGAGKRDVVDLKLPHAYPVRTGLAVDPTGKSVLSTGRGQGIFVLSLTGEEPRRLEGFASLDWVEDGAFSPSGRLVAAWNRFSESPTLRVWDLSSGGSRAFEAPREQRPEGYTFCIAFANETTIYTGGGFGLLRWDLEAGTSERILEASPGSTVVCSPASDRRRSLVYEVASGALRDSRVGVALLDLATGDLRSLTIPGEGGHLALSPDGTAWVTGGQDGSILIGKTDGGEAHLLAGHEGPVHSVAISPDNRWIASSGEDNTLRLWPMPDLDKPPLHTLPHDELIAKLKTLTNLRAVRDEESSTGWSIEIGPFPGWAEVPTW